MEIKINKEILDYQENIILGLSLRQVMFSAFGCVIAVYIYLFLIDSIGMEMTSWFCIFGALPFVLLGFFHFQGLYFEDLILVCLASVVLQNRKLTARETYRIRRKLRKKYAKKFKKNKKESEYFTNSKNDRRYYSNY